MPIQDAPTFQIDDARIIYRNFSGIEKEFNDAGDRNFCVIIDEENAEVMKKVGWNVKYQKPQGEDEEVGAPFIPVKVGYKFPPRVVLITSTGQTNLNESNIETLDYVDIAKADLICRGNPWSNPAGSGLKAYLKTLYVTVNEDELERRYNAGGGGERDVD